MTTYEPTANEVLISTLIDNLVEALRAAKIKRLHIFADAEPTFSLEGTDEVEAWLYRKPFEETLALLRAKQADAALMQTLY